MGLKRNQQQVRKKALIITYYWPPAGGPGVQRWLKFVKYLPEYNIDPIVFIPDNPNYPMTDESLLDEVSSEVKIVRFPISEFISTENIETIITTGPPHSLHLIGLQLKERLGVKWLADFRDPWTSIGYHKQLKLTKKSQLKHKFLEQQVLDHADQIIVTSFTTKKEFEGLTKQPVHVITNGYDMMSTAKSNLDKKFSISHIGSLLSKRNPDVLWRVFHDLINENKGFSKDFQLNLIGVVSDNVMKNIQNYNITDYVNKVGYVSHKEAITYQKKSQVLLLIEIDSDETKGIIPGKLFEYMVSNRPIIAIGPADSDVETIIKETNSGSYFNYNDYNSLKILILNHYGAFKNGTLQSHPIGLQKYSRKELTKSLSNLI